MMQFNTPYMQMKTRAEAEAPGAPKRAQYVPQCASALSGAGVIRSQEPMSPGRAFSPAAGVYPELEEDHPIIHRYPYKIDSNTRKYDETKRPYFPDNRRGDFAWKGPQSEDVGGDPWRADKWKRAEEDRQLRKLAGVSSPSEMPGTSEGRGVPYAGRSIDDMWLPDSTQGVPPQNGYVKGWTKCYPIRKLGKDQNDKGSTRKRNRQAEETGAVSRAPPLHPNAVLRNEEAAAKRAQEVADFNDPTRSWEDRYAPPGLPGVPPAHGYVTGYGRLHPIEKLGGDEEQEMRGGLLKPYRPRSGVNRNGEPVVNGQVLRRSMLSGLGHGKKNSMKSLRQLLTMETEERANRPPPGDDDSPVSVRPRSAYAGSEASSTTRMVAEQRLQRQLRGFRDFVVQEGERMEASHDTAAGPRRPKSAGGHGPGAGYTTRPDNLRLRQRSPRDELLAEVGRGGVKFASSRGDRFFTDEGLDETVAKHHRYAAKATRDREREATLDREARSRIEVGRAAGGVRSPSPQESEWEFLGKTRAKKVSKKVRCQSAGVTRKKKVSSGEKQRKLGGSDGKVAEESERERGRGGFTGLGGDSGDSDSPVARFHLVSPVGKEKTGQDLQSQLTETTHITQRTDMTAQTAQTQATEASAVTNGTTGTNKTPSLAPSLAVGYARSTASSDSYVSHGPLTYNRENPPLFDKYHFFNSSRIMADLGRGRPSMDGLRTLGDM